MSKLGKCGAKFVYSPRSWRNVGIVYKVLYTEKNFQKFKEISILIDRKFQCIMSKLRKSEAKCVYSARSRRNLGIVYNVLYLEKNFQKLKEISILIDRKF